MEKVDWPEPTASPDWAYLPTLVVQLISEKVKSIIDYVRFRAVCSPWRSSSLLKPTHLPPQLPWLMISYNSNPEDDGIRLFYDLWQFKLHKLHLPETIGKKCCASYRGWLVLLAPEGGKEVFLLNPLTRARIQLPPFSTPVKIFGVEQEECRSVDHYSYEPSIDDCIIKKLSFSTDLTDPNCLVIVFLKGMQEIFFCQVGDPCWTMVKMQEEFDATYHNGRFYFCSFEGAMRVYDLNNPEKRLVSVLPELQSVPKMFLEGKSGVYLIRFVVRNPETSTVAQEERHDPAHDTKYTVKPFAYKIELYQLLEQPFGLKHITDTTNTTIFYRGIFDCLTVCSDDWDSLDGGRMYVVHTGTFSAGKNNGGECNTVFSTKLDDGKLELVVSDFGEEPLWPAAPAMLFQPSFA
ncbi:F-box family protein [Rhynchospora pubera]|uniref:F-box family protein n=1 Tax=Rhynchospora pubera TaxID=906938 RepID=A0AAV8BTT6_9POAL|nr:F-box family protein [Rhynchospora pubera]